jgi:pheromone shutdown protein TraB
VQPEAHLRLGTCDLLLVGTIAGFGPDGERVQAAFTQHAPDKVALGVPQEDLPTLQVLAAQPERAQELPALDEAESHFQGLLARFGATRIPSPDLEAAFAAAMASGAAVEAIDLDDLTHSSAYTKGMKVRHLLRASSRRKKALKSTFPEATDAHGLAVAWDAALAVGPMRDLEREREAHMAARLRAMAATSARLLAIVPVARLAGIVAQLDSTA